MSDFQNPPRNDYERLPAAIRDVVSEHEYAWLSDSEKSRLEQSETEPDPEP